MLTVPCLHIATAESATLRLQTHHGLLTAEIESVPLQEILSALEQSLGLKVHWLDPSAAGMPISVSFKDVPVDISLKRILRSVSYTYFAEGNSRKVLVLASQASREFVAKAGGVPPVLPQPAAMLVNAPAEAPDEQVPAVAPDEAPNGNDEELTPLAKAESALVSSDANTQLDGVKQLSQLAAADTGGLVAIQSLKNVAQGSGRNSSEARLEAVRALSASASSDAASKQQALTALRVLSRNRDKAVRELAKKTMSELRAEQ